MKIRIAPFKLLINDEYVFKKITIFFGILYWLYGLMPISDTIFNIISVVNLLFVIYIFIQGDIDYIKKYAVLIFLMGVISVLANEFRIANVIAVAYGLIETSMMTYCSKQKAEQRLVEELYKIVKMFLRVGTIVILLSLVTFFAGVHKDYYYGSITSTALHLGRDTTTGALTGVLSNANIAADFFVIYLAFLLFVGFNEKIKPKYCLCFVMALVALYYTYSRGGYVGALVLFGISFIFFAFLKCRLKYGILFLIAGGFFIIICAMLLYFSGAFQLNSINIGGRDAAQMGSSTQTRMLLWEAGLKSAFSSPKNLLFGVGNEIKDSIAIYASPQIDKGLYNNMHNIYVQILVGFGFIGLILFLVLVFSIIVISIKRLFEQGLSSKDMIPIIALSIAFLLINIVESDMFYKKAFEGTVIWVCFGYMNQILKLRRMKP